MISYCHIYERFKTIIFPFNAYSSFTLFQTELSMAVNFNLKPVLRFSSLTHQPHNCFSLFLNYQVISKNFSIHSSIIVLILPPQNRSTHWGSELLKVPQETIAEPGAENSLPRPTHSKRLWTRQKNTIYYPNTCLFSIKTRSNEHQNKRKNSLCTQCMPNHLLLR